MKKIITKAIIAMAAFAAAVSCSLMEQDVTFSEGNEVKFVTNIQAFGTRADISTTVAFRNGDEVGIIAMEPIMANNVKYTVSGSSLTSETPIHWAAGQTASSHFIGMFPYDPTFNLLNEYNYVFSVQEDQSDADNYRKSDLLIAEGEGAPGSPVQLNFYHYFSRVDITVSGELKGKVASVSLSGVATSRKVEDWEATDQDHTIKAGHVSASADGTTQEFWSLILIPQEAMPTVIVTTTDGQTLTYNIGKKTTFASGKRYDAVLTTGDDGSLTAEFVFRIFDWLLGETVSFEQYVPRWFLCGPFTDHQDDYEMEKREDGTFATSRITFPAGAEFKFRLDHKTEGNIGCVDGTSGELLAGTWTAAARDGYFFTVRDEGVYRVVLDVTNMRVMLEPGADWTVSRDYYTEADGWKNEYIPMEYQGGLTWKATEVFMPPMSRFYFVDSNNPYYFKTYAHAEEATYLSDGARALAAEPGTYDVDTDGNGAYLYYEQGGFVDITLDLAAGTIQFVRSSNQTMTIDAVLNGIPDGYDVSLSNVTVYARSTRGVIVSDDGKKGLFIYMGTKPDYVPAVGDVISVSGKVQTYDGLPEISNATVTSSGRTAELSQVEYTDISDSYISPDNAHAAIPVKIHGQLNVWFGNTEVCYVVGANDFKFYFPFDEYLKYAGSSVSATGWYTGTNNGLSSLVLTGVEGLNELPHGSGTLRDPFDITGACLYVKSLDYNAISQDKYYVRGVVASIKTPFSAGGQATFTIGDTGRQREGTFTAYNVNFLGDGQWKFGNTQISNGSEVILYGNLVYYNGTTPETATGQAYIYSLNGKTEERVDDIVLSGDGTYEHPYNIAAAVNLAQSPAVQQAGASEFVYISGKVSEVYMNFARGNNGYFKITESGQTDEQFSVYARSCHYLGNTMWSEEDTDIKAGDEVIICARINSSESNNALTTYDYGKNDPWLYSLNGVVKTIEPTIELEMDALRVAETAYNYEVGVYADVSFSVSCEADWLTVYNLGTSILIYTQDNTSTSERSAEIKLYYDNGATHKEVILTVTQIGQDLPAPTEFEGNVIWQGRDFIHEWGDYNAELGYLSEYPKVFCQKYQNWAAVPAGTTMRIYYVCDNRYEQHQIFISTYRRGFDTEKYYAAGALDPSTTYVDIPLTEAFISALSSESGLLLAGRGYDLYAVTLIDAE